MLSPVVSPFLCLCLTLVSTVPAWAQAPVLPPNVPSEIVIIGPDGKEHRIDSSKLAEDLAKSVTHPTATLWPNRAAIGVIAQPLPEGIAEHLGLEPGQGVLVSKTFDDGPAAKAGLQAQDIIVQVGDEAVKSPADLQRLIQQSGETALEITWLHVGKKQTGQVTPVKGSELKTMQNQELEFMLKDLAEAMQGQSLNGLRAPGILLQAERPIVHEPLSQIHEQLSEINKRMSNLEQALKEIQAGLNQD